MKLEWIHHDKLPMYLARSPAAKAGDFRVLYDDAMHWDAFSDLSPSPDLESIKFAAQQIHDDFINSQKDV